MKIFLMRHGHAVTARHDPERPLLKEGQREAARAGEFLRKIDEAPDVIIHSPLTRSRMTAEGVAEALGVENILQPRVGLEPEDDVRDCMSDILSEYDASDGKIMIVGHEPLMSEFAILLLTGSMAGLSLNFSRGTLLGAESIGCGRSRTWKLRFYLTAEDLARLIWVP
jgi:phosphohistidine phosphatase